MKVKHYNRQTQKNEEYELMFWKDRKFWKCKVPSPNNELSRIMKKLTGRSEKEMGLIGQGKTKEEALEDWREWKHASDLVAEIY